MTRWVLATVIILGLIALVVVGMSMPYIVRAVRGRTLLRRVRRARPGCVAFVVGVVPAPQPDLERLTDGRVLTGKLVLSAEATGIELWTSDSADPVMQLAWSSVESTGVGGYTSSSPTSFETMFHYGYGPSGETIAFNLAGGGSVNFTPPREPLPLDLLHQLEATREPAARRAELES